MAQITGAISSNSFKIEISANGSSWTDISGAANTITPTGGEKATGETYTFDGDNPIVTTGKSQPWEAEVAVVYTEGASDAPEIVRPIYENGTDFYLRYSPKGGQTGEFVYTAGPGKASNFVYPGGDASSGDPVMSGFTYRGPKPTKSVAS
jgi:hypothetical protein